MGSSDGVASASCEFSVRSKDVNPESCAGRGISGACSAVGTDASLPRVRNSCVNPALPFPSCPGRGGFSAMGALPADAIRSRSSRSGELSAAPPPNSTLCTTGSAKAFGAGTGWGTGCGFAASGARLPLASGPAPEPNASSSTGSGAFTTPKTPVAPKSRSEPESSGAEELGALGPAEVVGLSIQSDLRCDAGSINHSLLSICLFIQKEFG